MNEPRLIEAGQRELQELIDNIKAEVLSKIESGMRSIYCDVAHYAETDSWTNYRSDMQQQLAYDNGILKDDYGWAKNVRLKILQENRHELIEFLNKDLVERVKELEDKLKEYDSRRYF